MKSIGEKRVRTDFNVSGSSVVDEFKSKSAALVNLVQNGIDMPDGTPPEAQGEFVRLKSLAMTAYEEAAMWAVKAATWQLEN